MKNLVSAIIALLLAAIIVNSAQAGLLFGRGARVPASQLGEYDDSCRCWVMIFNRGDQEYSSFLVDAVNSYGLGRTIRVVVVNPEMTAWSDWRAWHSDLPTILTLSADGKRVLSIASVGKRTLEGKEVPLIPGLYPNDPTATKRKLELAKLLTLEDPSGMHGRLLNPNKPPYWLPAVRYEKWYERCPDGNCPPNNKNVNVDVQVGPPQMDPNLLQALNSMNERDEIEDFTPLIIVSCVLALICAVFGGLYLNRWYSGDD